MCLGLIGGTNEPAPESPDGMRRVRDGQIVRCPWHNWEFDVTTGQNVADPRRRVFVIGDPREPNVPFSSQALYFEGLVARGHGAWLVPLTRARDSRHHDLVDFGEVAAGLCAAGKPTARILEALRTLPEPPPRLSSRVSPTDAPSSAHRSGAAHARRPARGLRP